MDNRALLFPSRDNLILGIYTYVETIVKFSLTIYTGLRTKSLKTKAVFFLSTTILCEQRNKYLPLIFDKNFILSLAINTLPSHTTNLDDKYDNNSQT